MLRKGSWCGETHIQKAAFFLQEMLSVDMGYEFILYKHGPFSFELRDELVSMQADQLLELAVRQQGYGPTYLVTEFGGDFLKRFPKTTARYLDQVAFVSDEMGDKGVAELEKLATAFFIANRERSMSTEDRAQMLVELKPHISLSEARRATDQMDLLILKSHAFNYEEREEYSA
jgi:hypothetical protein